jgi:hypothetical protein
VRIGFRKAGNKSKVKSQKSKVKNQKSKKGKRVKPSALCSVPSAFLGKAACNFLVLAGKVQPASKGR